MALSKQDREYITEVSKNCAIEVVRSFIQPMQKKIEEHDNMLNNGIRSSVDNLRASVDEHIKEYKEYTKEKRLGKRKFWLTLSTGLLGGTIIAFLTAIFTKIV